MQLIALPPVALKDLNIFYKNVLVNVYVILKERLWTILRYFNNILIYSSLNRNYLRNHLQL